MNTCTCTFASSHRERSCVCSCHEHRRSRAAVNAIQTRRLNQLSPYERAKEAYVSDERPVPKFQRVLLPVAAQRTVIAGYVHRERVWRRGRQAWRWVGYELTFSRETPSSQLEEAYVALPDTDCDLKSECIRAVARLWLERNPKRKSRKRA